jgi:mono/diheme cytochrome c family protein
MARHHPDGDLAWKIAEGRGAMPGWKQILPEKNMWDLVNFIRSLGR